MAVRFSYMDTVGYSTFCVTRIAISGVEKLALAE